jgi:ferredoxin
MEVRVDQELCIGAAVCLRHAAGAFALNDDEVAVVLDPVEATEEQLRRAADRCPAGAIYLEE